MTPSPSSTSPRTRRSPRLDGAPSSPRRRTARGRSAHRQRQSLTRYTDPHGRIREVIAQQGFGGSVLVVDRDAVTHGDQRLVAHLAADEPADNAALVCAHYLRDSPRAPRRCRRLSAEDAHSAPFVEDSPADPHATCTPPSAEPVDTVGCSYRLERLPGGMSIPELRWRRHWPPSVRRDPELVSLRDAVASLESYEPVRTLTMQALARQGGDGDVSTTVLRSELRRVQESPIVLNRRLREVVLEITRRRQLSMSEIACRCGRIKRDGNGNESGETSWLARRLGLLAEGGRGNPTPWIHSDVLALISRRGLGVAPREVELG